MSGLSEKRHVRQCHDTCYPCMQMVIGIYLRCQESHTGHDENVILF